MNYFRRLEPTPAALRNGRLVMLIVAAVLVGGLGLMAMDPGFRDPGTVAIFTATGVTVAGHAIAYVGQPTLARYRVGLVVMAIGIVAAFGFLFLAPPPGT